MSKKFSVQVDLAVFLHTCLKINEREMRWNFSLESFLKIYDFFQQYFSRFTFTFIEKDFFKVEHVISSRLVQKYSYESKKILSLG